MTGKEKGGILGRGKASAKARRGNSLGEFRNKGKSGFSRVGHRRATGDESWVQVLLGPNYPSSQI